MANNDLKRRADENTEQYLWRVGKMIDDGVYANWESVTNVVNEELHIPQDKWKGESAFRKHYASGKKFYNNVFAALEGDNYLNELHKQQEELFKERKKLSAIKLEYNRWLTQEARRELFYENIAETIPQTDIKIPKYSSNGDSQQREYVLTLSDIHYGAEFRSMNNEYDTNEAISRFAALRDRALKFIEEKNLERLIVLGLGDDIQGIIHMSDISLNQQPVVKSIVEVSQLISELLIALSNKCKIEYYHVPSANHAQTRPLNSKANALSYEDVTYVISHYIETAVDGNDNISVHLAPETQDYLSFKIFDFNIYASHGHTVKNISQHQRDISFVTGIHYDYAFLGHFHESKNINMGERLFHDCETLIAPSFVGSDPYSDSLYKGSRPASMIYGFDPYEGHIESYKIILA